MRVQRYDLVLAFYPHARGFAYIVFEGPHSPVDWGMSDLPHKQKRAACLRRLAFLLNQYHPDVVVLRNMRRRSDSNGARAFMESMEILCEEAGAANLAICRNQIRSAFAHLGSTKRHAIAREIAKHVPIFGPLLPPVRKIWNGEDRRMGLFDAAALALTFFHSQRECALEGDA